MAQEKKATGEPRKRSTSRKKTDAVAPSTPEMEQPMPTTARESKPPATAHGTKGAPDADEIRRRAYQLWEQRGGTHGSHEDDWYRAEEEIRNKESRKRSA